MPHLMFNTGVKEGRKAQNRGRTFRLMMRKTCECRACEDEKTAQQDIAAVPLMQNISKDFKAQWQKDRFLKMQCFRLGDLRTTCQFCNL